MCRRAGRDASEFDAGYYETLLEKEWDEVAFMFKIAFLIYSWCSSIDHSRRHNSMDDTSTYTQSSP
jgi:hypothetical protein